MAVYAVNKGGLVSVQVEGLNELMDALRAANSDGERIVKDAIRESGSLVLATAQSRASAFAASGAFRGTLSIKQVRNGIKLSSNDAAAGVIEFANRGARTRTSKGTPLANARLAKRSGVGVPRTANPRSMIPAINENTLTIQNKVAAALERAICGNG